MTSVDGSAAGQSSSSGRHRPGRPCGRRRPEIDLGAEQIIRDIRLLTSQFPAGETVHEVRVRGEETVFETVFRFEGATEDMQWLTYLPESPLENVRYIRINTLSSPSWIAWREVEVR